jgi:putative chitinase
LVTISYDILRKIAPQCKIAASLVDPLNKYLSKYEITSLLRLEHFLGQASEETAGFATLTEYASGREYELRRDLGNTLYGDGVKYKGRGIFQITGKYNYRKYGNLLGIDLISNPQMAATPEIAVRTACEYWKDHKLNELADDDDLEGITRRINGGLNGIADRTIYVNRADSVLSEFFPKDEEGRFSDNKGT